MAIRIRYPLLWIALGGTLLFLPFLGQVHLFDWDEANFAEAAREMLVTGDWLTVQINYEPFWEKPPFFIWLQALSMKTFGVNEFAARFPNAICGIVTLCLLFLAGKKLSDETTGWLWVLAYAGSILPFFYFKSGIIDPWFNLFMFLGVWFIFRSEEKENCLKFLFFAGLFTGLAVLTKGPVGLLIVLLTWFVILLLKKFRDFPSLKGILLFTGAFVIAGGLWFLIEIISGKSYVIMDFIRYQIRLLTTRDAGHGGPFFYHFAVVLFGCFPASVIALRSFGRMAGPEPGEAGFRRWMIVLLLVVLLLFSFVRTKIVHYSSLSYFPVTFLAALAIRSWLRKGIRPPKRIIRFTAILGTIIALALIALPLLMMNKDRLIESGMVTGMQTPGLLQAEAGWTGFDTIPGILLLAGMIIFTVLARRKMATGALMLFGSTVIAVFLAMVLIAPRVEHHVQRAAIEFYKQHDEGKSYVQPLGFKSYAYLFYTKKPVPADERHNEKEWLFYGDTGKPVYFVIRQKEAAQHEGWFPHFNKLYEKNGFVFYKRGKLPE